MQILKKIADFDNRVSEAWTNHTFSEKMTRFLRFYVRLGDGYIWALFVVFLIFKIGFFAFLPILGKALVAMVVSLGIYEWIKLSTKRERPFVQNPRIKAEVPPLDKYSFPSGHTMNNLAVAGVVFLAIPEYGWIMLLFPFSWGLLRVYFGVHYLTDILCGFVFGILCAVLTHFIWFILPW